MREIILKVPAKRASRFHTHPADDAEPHGIGHSFPQAAPRRGDASRQSNQPSLVFTPEIMTAQFV